MGPGLAAAWETAGLLFAAISAGAVAWMLGRRRVEDALAPGLRAFRAYWAATAGGGLVLVAFLTTARAGLLPLPALLALLALYVTFHAAASAGLVTHILFLLGGSRVASRVGMPVFLAVSYAGALALFAMDVRGIRYQGSDLIMEASGMNGGPLAFITIGLFAPLVLAALGYAWLFARTSERTPRFRIAALALSVLMSSLGPSTAIGADAMGRLDILFFAIGMIALAPLAVLTVYAPPRWLQERLGVAPLLKASEALDVLAGRRQY